MLVWFRVTYSFCHRFHQIQRFGGTELNCYRYCIRSFIDKVSWLFQSSLYWWDILNFVSGFMYPFQYFGQAILSRGEFFKLKSMLRHKKAAHSEPLMLASPIVKAAFLVFAQMIYAAFTPCHLQSLYRIDGFYLSEKEECVSTCERPIPTLITWPTSTQLLVLTVNLFALSIPTTDTELLSALLWKSLGGGGL